MKKPNVSADTIRAYLRSNPGISTRAAARVLYREHPTLWRSEESCRGLVRFQRGQKGANDRKYAKPEFVVKGSCVPFPPLPKPLSEWDSEWCAEQFGEGRYAILQDLHIPYHDADATETALTWLEQQHPTHMILNGDVADFFAVSKWENDPRRRNLAGELAMVQQFLGHLRGRFPKCAIVWNIGNHEERWERYLWVKAPELVGVPQFSYESIFKTADHGVRISSDKRPLRLGKLNVIHGHEYSFPISNPVNPSRGLFLRAKTHACCGHFHQSSNHSERTLEQLVVGTWSFGCLCQLHPRYRPLNNWNHGFGFVEVTDGGTFQVHSKKIINGEVYSA